MDFLISILDWFIPAAPTLDRSLRAQMRNFVATHLIGPVLSSPIGIVLLTADPQPWPTAWVIVIAVCAFWALPLVLRATGDLVLCATISVLLLSFTCLFGALYYGGVSSPFLSWLIVALMLGFFYLNRTPRFVLALFALNFCAFYVAYLAYGSQRIPLRQLETVGWVSIGSATLYMSWMAVYYAILTRMGSELELEAERHRDTAVRLRLAKERAEKADRTRSIFLAKMSHELRTPLNAVIGYSEILLDAVEFDGKAPEKKSDLERINAAGKHLLALVADVMDMTKIERNEIELKPERFDLGSFFQSVIATTDHLVVARGNRLVFLAAVDDEPLRAAASAPGSDLGEAVTDPTKLRQVVINLLSNAAKFTEGGVITLAVRRATRPGGDWIEVQVRDTGVGIGPEERERPFQAYGQASASTSGKYGGTGLGLAISQKLCALMGGGVTLASEKGRGSCFTVRVPVCWAAETEAGPSPAPAFAPA